ncbi:MAG: hypothetical protein KF788_08805 [Piscinibacter sp.]|nr:hypothetical protein [Piscinibacter sp.]
MNQPPMQHGRFPGERVPLGLFATTRSDTPLGAVQVEAIDRMAALLTGESLEGRRVTVFTERLTARWHDLGGTLQAIKDDVTNDPMNHGGEA